MISHVFVVRSLVVTKPRPKSTAYKPCYCTCVLFQSTVKEELNCKSLAYKQYKKDREVRRSLYIWRSLTGVSLVRIYLCIEQIDLSKMKVSKKTVVNGPYPLAQVQNNIIIKTKMYTKPNLVLIMQLVFLFWESEQCSHL